MVFQRPTPFPGNVADNLAVAHPEASANELGIALKRVALDPGLLDQDARWSGDRVRVQLDPELGLVVTGGP